MQQVEGLEFQRQFVLKERTAQFGIPYEVVGVHQFAVVAPLAEHLQFCGYKDFQPRYPVLHPAAILVVEGIEGFEAVALATAMAAIELSVATYGQFTVTVFQLCVGSRHQRIHLAQVARGGIVGNVEIHAVLIFQVALHKVGQSSRLVKGAAETALQVARPVAVHVVVHIGIAASLWIVGGACAPGALCEGGIEAQGVRLIFFNRAQALGHHTVGSPAVRLANNHIPVGIDGQLCIGIPVHTYRSRTCRSGRGTLYRAARGLGHDKLHSVGGTVHRKVLTERSHVCIGRHSRIQGEHVARQVHVQKPDVLRITGKTGNIGEYHGVHGTAASYRLLQVSGNH